VRVGLRGRWYQSRGSPSSRAAMRLACPRCRAFLAMSARPFGRAAGDVSARRAPRARVWSVCAGAPARRVVHQPRRSWCWGMVASGTPACDGQKDRSGSAAGMGRRFVIGQMVRLSAGRFSRHGARPTGPADTGLVQGRMGVCGLLCGEGWVASLLRVDVIFARLKIEHRTAPRPHAGWQPVCARGPAVRPA